MPEYYIRKYFKKTPQEVFSRVGFSGKPLRTVALVQSGAYEVGATNFKGLEKGIKNGTIDPKSSRDMENARYPDYNWSIRGDVDNTYGAGFIKKGSIGAAVDERPGSVEFVPAEAFIPADNSDYAPIKDTQKSSD